MFAWSRWALGDEFKLENDAMRKLIAKARLSKVLQTPLAVAPLSLPEAVEICA